MPSIPTALDVPADKLDDEEKNVVANIREHGWFGHHIFDAEGDLPGFSYTTGFWQSRGAPEVIVFSLKSNRAHDLLWNLYNDTQNGTRFPLGRPVPDVLEGLNVYFLPVDKKHYAEHLGWSRWFYGGDKFPCVQLVWPDRDNRFPWQNGFDSALANRQPILSDSIPTA